MIHIPTVHYDDGSQHADPKRRVLTHRDLVNRLRRRRYSWGKSMRELADESGLRTEQLRDVLLGKPFNEVVAARLAGYLTTPVGPRGLITDRNKRAPNRSRRFAVIRKIVQLAQLSRRYGLFSRKSEMLKEWTEGRLQAYYWNLDSRLKSELMKRNPQLAGRYNLPDALEAWEWVERFEQLRTGKIV